MSFSIDALAKSMLGDALPEMMLGDEAMLTLVIWSCEECCPFILMLYVRSHEGVLVGQVVRIIFF